MKFRKKSNYSKEDLKIARLARAMGHPARIAILRHLASGGTCSFHDLTKQLPLAESTVSQHVTELKKCGLINSSSKRPNVHYSISLSEWKTARKIFKEFMRMMTGKNERHN